MNIYKLMKIEKNLWKLLKASFKNLFAKGINKSL